jgi:hypothetical protein
LGVTAADEEVDEDFELEELPQASSARPTATPTVPARKPRRLSDPAC